MLLHCRAERRCQDSDVLPRLSTCFHFYLIWLFYTNSSLVVCPTLHPLSLAVYLGFFHALFAPQNAHLNCLGDVNDWRCLETSPLFLLLFVLFFRPNSAPVRPKAQRPPYEMPTNRVTLYGGNSIPVPKPVTGSHSAVIYARRESEQKGSVNLIRCPTISLLDTFIGGLGDDPDLRWKHQWKTF